MSISSFLFHLISGATGSVMALSLVIILGTFILEDPTTVIVGVLAADGIIKVPFALLSLYAGIVCGDIGLYGIGWLASTHPRLARYVDHQFVAPFRIWLESRYVLTIFSARFIPGSRFPTYTASGFFRSPLSTFVLTAIVATSVWTTLLFYASYWFGSFTVAWMGPVRWGIAIAFLLILLFLGRQTLLHQRTKQREADSAADTRRR